MNSRSSRAFSYRYSTISVIMKVNAVHRGQRSQQFLLKLVGFLLKLVRPHPKLIARRVCPHQKHQPTVSRTLNARLQRGDGAGLTG